MRQAMQYVKFVFGQLRPELAEASRIFGDRQNQLARILGYRAIPNGYLFGPDGLMIDQKVTNFDLLREATAHA